MKVKAYYQTWVSRISWKFLLCVCGTALLCGLGRFLGSAPEGNEVSLYAWLHYSREELLLMGESASAYFVMAGFQDMEWFAVLLPVLAVFPVATDFAEQWFGGYYYVSVSRKTRVKYASAWMARAALQGFVCIVSGILLYFVLVYLKFPHYGEFGVEAESSMVAMAYGVTAAERVAVLLVRVFHTGLLAAILAMGGVVLTVLCKEGFFAVSSLALMGYFSQKLQSAYEGWLILRYYNQGQPDVPMVCKAVRFLFPSNHLYYGQSFSAEYGVGYWLYLVFAGVLLAGIWAWFYRLVKRRDG